VEGDMTEQRGFVREDRDEDVAQKIATTEVQGSSGEFGINYRTE
jgi:hypothetical protein